MNKKRITFALSPIFRHPEPLAITRRKNGVNAGRYASLINKILNFKLNE